MNDLPMGQCSAKMCGYGAFDGGLGCQSDDGSCWTAMMCEAEITDFHDAELYDATARIQDILNEFSDRKDGKKLSFVHTEEGTMLAWVHHGVKFPPHAVSFKHGHKKVKDALKIKGPKKR